MRPRLPLLLGLLVLGLAACGGSSSAGSGADDPASVLKQTFGPGRPVRSGKLDLALSLDPEGLTGLGGPFTVRLTGPFESAGNASLPRVAFAIALGIGSQRFSAGATSTGDRGYLTLGRQAYVLDHALFKRFKAGYEQAAGQSGSRATRGSGLAALGVAPLRWLKDPKSAGVQDVGGVRSRHITATVDVPKLLTDVDTLLGKAPSLGAGAGVPTKLTAAQRATIERSVKSVSFDLWSGRDDGTLRRLLVKLAFEVPADARQGVGGLSRGSFAFDLKISDLNRPQTIAAPAGARPLSELPSLLDGLLDSGSAPGSQSAPPSPPVGDVKYTECVAKAGSDITAVQKCAPLLGR